MSDTYSLEPRAIGGNLLIDVRRRNELETLTAGQVIVSLETAIAQFEASRQAFIAEIAKDSTRAAGLQFNLDSLNSQIDEAQRAMTFVARQVIAHYKVDA